ncbi:hypothetical protein MPTK1_1g07820 [Marchantia polymorpha subsp. ruderalis]|uniref:Uncharacterized protein n=2 Tax=Marchantia polymorpha TaxID=3197 RepID=A0AAF6AMP7_MARPO|nr:hypothetical protein MARPO_0036s0026 [Marchantia polymorpha]PTQ41020.1 hypothetical protein MARPO_0036s0026 [Marchantia polymorpha]BBM97716.1 hypothetical protein Mp_1g07820 [Marchantia polymorpha subsp. ruderalis]BBM97717.1 hypothetical protein Mp_1g07820 [Marchantia polymorpha subsp. ruderalis]|eukprot:PTQ41019.1 hypothetical protein MARPO_0036s0026 [Marchantia polymorpha]
MSAPIYDGTVGDRLVNMTGRKPGRRIKGDLGTNDEDERREFKKILKEVEELGTSQLEWKERKALEQKKLLTLGAKPKKSWKMPISMGLSVKRKREQAESDKVEELLAGLRPNKSRRKPPPPRDSTEDKGLQASEGKFRGGVLYVKPLVKAPVETKRRGGDRSLDRVFSDGKGRKGGGKKGKGKGKGKGGGKKGGGKRKR